MVQGNLFRSVRPACVQGIGVKVCFSGVRVEGRQLRFEGLGLRSRG